MGKNTKIWVGLLGLLLIVSIVFAAIVANPAGGLRSAREYTIVTPTQSLQIDTGVVKITTGATSDNTTSQYSPAVKTMAGLMPLFFVIMIVAYVFKGLDFIGKE